jgi:AcrR family transcriptional regulator
MKAKKAKAAQSLGAGSDQPVRERILWAAFSAFRERGYDAATTLEIATRAKASKRELYALFDGKHAILTACIAEHAQRIRPPLDLPAPISRASVAATLTAFGTAALRGVCEPAVLAVYRLAIGESERSPNIAKVLDTAGRGANHAALSAFLDKARTQGLFAECHPETMATVFSSLLWGNLLIRLLLRVTPVPTIKEMERRASDASRALLALYPAPGPGEAS